MGLVHSINPLLDLCLVCETSHIDTSIIVANGKLQVFVNSQFLCAVASSLDTRGEDKERKLCGAKTVGTTLTLIYPLAIGQRVGKE